MIDWLYLTDGNWDIEALDYTAIKTYQNMAQIYEANYNYKETQLYSEIVSTINEKGKYKHKNIVIKTEAEASKK